MTQTFAVQGGIPARWDLGRPAIQKPNPVSVLQVPQTMSPWFVTVQGLWNSTLEYAAWLGRALSGSLVSRWIQVMSPETPTRRVCPRFWASFGQMRNGARRR